MTRGDRELGFDVAFRLEDDAAVDPEEVTDDKGDLCFSVVEDEAARVQFVMDVLGGEGGESADDGLAKGRGDDAGGGAGTQGGLFRFFRLHWRGESGGEEEQGNDEDKAQRIHGPRLAVGTLSGKTEGELRAGVCAGVPENSDFSSRFREARIFPF